MRYGALALLLLASCVNREGLDRTDLRPSDVSAVAVELFREMCVAQLPSMETVRATMVTIAEREFGQKPTLDRDAYSTAASKRGGVILTRGTPAWPPFNGEHRCEVSAAAVQIGDTTDAMLDLFKQDGPSVFTLTEVRPDEVGEQSAWSLTGAKPNMRLEVATGASAAGGTRQIALRLVWRDQ